MGFLCYPKMKFKKGIVIFFTPEMQPCMEVDASRFLMTRYLLKNRVVYTQKLITEPDYSHWILPLHKLNQ